MNKIEHIWISQCDTFITRGTTGQILSIGFLGSGFGRELFMYAKIKLRTHVSSALKWDEPTVQKMIISVAN